MTPPTPPTPTREPRAATSRIDRAATGVRIVLTVLFAIVARVIELLLTVLVLFELVMTLVSQQPPSRKIRDFANQVCTYLYRVTRYLTYNEAEPPFPFTDFPEPIEPPTEEYDVTRGAPDAASHGEPRA